MKTFVWMILALTLLIPFPGRALDGPPNLTGKWVLNEKMSDDFAEVMKEARGSGTGRPEGKGGRGGGRRSGGGRSGGDNEDQQIKAQERLEYASKEYSRLEIFHDDIELNVTNGMEITRLLYTDGREMDIWTQHGEAKATATWQGHVLVVEWKTREDSTSRTRHYTLADGGRQLIMTENHALPGQDKAMGLTMVYDLEE